MTDETVSPVEALIERASIPTDIFWGGGTGSKRAVQPLVQELVDALRSLLADNERLRAEAAKEERFRRVQDNVIEQACETVHYGNGSETRLSLAVAAYYDECGDDEMAADVRKALGPVDPSEVALFARQALSSSHNPETAT